MSVTLDVLSVAGGTDVRILFETALFSLIAPRLWSELEPNYVKLYFDATGVRQVNPIVLYFFLTKISLF